MSRARISYPWASVLVGVLLVVYLAVTSHEDLVVRYGIPPEATRWDYQLMAIAGFIVVVFADTIRFFRRLSGYDLRMAKYEDQIKELLQAKRELQTRAHKYSRHADKLKLFISDRLLEYIEYDERYLHFKSIAAEIRHNGVITYDKVQMALRAAIAECEVRAQAPDALAAVPTARSLGVRAGGAAGDGQGDRAGEYRDALRSLIYFWDLLDLVTTDNIAMHVASKIYECEELHYQTLLQDEVQASAPISPTYQLRDVLTRALCAFVDEPHALRAAAATPGEALRYSDDAFWVELDDAGELLGNENHILLLAENILNNAVSYADKIRHKRRCPRIAVQLRAGEREAKLAIYNPGPTIDAENEQQIFQLGFSTLRGKDHHGRGLGLYFVNEIVRGYGGTIAFENIANATDTVSVRVQLGDEIRTEVIEIEVSDGKPVCYLAGAGERSPQRAIEWKFPRRLASIEVSTQSDRATSRFAHFGDAGDDSATRLTDPRHPGLPRWALEVNNRKRSCRVVFVPLDVGGVRFDVALPTAAARLDYTEQESAEPEFDEVEAMRGNFREIS